MPEKPRRATEDSVMAAAARIIAEEGYQNLTMEGVARLARAGKATVYRWWPSRGHLLLALYSQAKSGLTEPDTGDLESDLTAYFSQMLHQWNGGDGQEALAPMLRLLIAEAQTDDTMRAALSRERRERWLHLDNIMRRAHQRGQLNPALTLERAEQRVISMMWYLLLNDTLPPADQAGELVRDVLVDLRG
ncbi:TetR/AcrR family transcriptional regulator [Paracoccus sp. M683]|uniref:TetR/AcrR family transcriptional regulator n=1 Tax=Paracoccus sp. M683 TaxID=2594268 RepID=UPI001180D129|nr:TetR/AcrR family transcriptional regulator [Paracoccus sp. M683]TRW95934.1 TetR/AcrR family transcriptional regulator [Paracoccus sp. M683]